MKINELLVENTSSKVFQSMGSQLLQIGKDADKIKKHDPETLKQGIVKKLEQIDDPKLTHATTTFLQKAVKFNRNNPKTMAAIFGFTFAIIARVSMQISHHYGLSPTQATLIIEATLPTLGNFLGYLINGFSVKDSVQAGLIAGTIGVGGTIAASGALTEFAPTRQGGAGDDYLRVLASAWYNDTFNTGSLQKGIKSQEDVERLLQRGIVCNDGKKRKYNIGYNGNYDGVVIYSDDYYEYGDESGKLDSRTGKPWGPYEYIEYHDSQLDETKLNEFAPNDGGDRPKFIPWHDFIEGVKGIVGNDFSVTEKIIKNNIQDRFVPYDALEYGPTMLYSYYEARLGRKKGAVSTRGAIQVGKYYPNTTGLGKQNFITSFNLLKGHPFERHFDLTPENISKIAAIIMGNTEGRLQG